MGAGVMGVSEKGRLALEERGKESEVQSEGCEERNAEAMLDRVKGLSLRCKSNGKPQKVSDRS